MKDRFEETVSMWVMLSPEKPCDRDLKVTKLAGGPGKDFVKFKVVSKDSGHGNAGDKVVIMAFGK